MYTEDDVQRILVIRRMKPLEFTLGEMRELLDALDTLNRDAATEEEVQLAQAVLVNCRHRVRAAIVRLGKRLAYAAELDGILEQKAQDPSRPL
jgi:DNA-binding transcriptional MerR regulator